MQITGKVVYQEIGTGFWGIISDKGQEYRPVNMPEQLKCEGKRISVKARLVEGVSIFMWGTSIEITSFSTVSP